MECPHCLAEFEGKPHKFALGIDQDGTWQVSNLRCPMCDRLIVSLCTEEGCTYPAWPVSTSRARLSEDVPMEFAAEYHAACQVLAYSPEASAAISRRLLHRFLADVVHVGHGGLSDQIRQAIVSQEVPPYIKDALQNLSNLAKLEPDSSKSLRPEAMAPTEPGEVEWHLDVLQLLFDLYFVQPAKMRRKLARLEEKIAPPAPAKTEAAPPEEAKTEVVAAGDAPATAVTPKATA